MQLCEIRNRSQKLDNWATELAKREVVERGQRYEKKD